MIGLSPPGFVPDESSSFDQEANSVSFEKKKKKKSSLFPFSPKGCESELWHWEWKAVRNGRALRDLTGKANSENSVTCGLSLTHQPGEGRASFQALCPLTRWHVLFLDVSTLSPL